MSAENVSPESRRRFLARAQPGRFVLVLVLAIATVPALTIGLVAEAYVLAGNVIPAPDRRVALILVAAPLAALLLATALMHLRARTGNERAIRGEADRTNRRLGAIIGATEDAFIVLDPEGGIRGWNPAAERLYAIPAAEAMGRSFETLIHPRDRAAAREAFLKVVAGDRRATSVGRHRRGDAVFPTTATWSAVRDQAGTIEGITVLIRDTTLAAEATIAQAAAGRLDQVERRTRLLTDATSDAVISADDGGRIVDWNPAATRLFGFTAEQAVGTPFEDLLADDGAGQPTHDGAPVRVLCRRADGSTLPAELLIASYEDAGSTRHTAFIRDISERLAAEDRAAEQESRYRDLVERLPGVIYRSRIGRWAPFDYLSPHLETLLGYRPDEWIDVPGQWEQHLHPADLERVLAEDEAEAGGPPGTARGEDREYRMRTRDGREIWIQDHADLERDGAGTPVAWHGFMTDITERKRLESELLQLAFHDPLTGLANRALLNDRVAHAIARHQLGPTMLAMLVLDVDDFKRINDAHGHDAGDRTLVAVGERLKESVRANATLARLGGDEFAILLEGLTDDAAALVVAQRVVRAFDKPLRVEGVTVTARVSVGVAVDTTRTRPGSWLMRSADTAMHEAKRLGKGRWQAYDPAAHLASAKRLVLESELRRAVERKQFILAYQPVTDLRTGEIVGSEALIRWNHPTRGIVPPGEFISVLESTRLIEPVGRWVVDEAVRQAAAWQQTLPSLAWTAVNVSAAQLRSDEFFACVRDALRTHGLCPSRLTLEVTESLALDDTVGTAERLTALRELGVLIAIDDFGTGYSSLSYLRRLPIDKLKIDRAFVDGIGSDPEATAVARAIVELAKGLRLTTIAEGIEHPHQAETLVALGCELGQGYLFAKPLRAPDLAALVAGRLAVQFAGRGGTAQRLPA